MGTATAGDPESAGGPGNELKQDAASLSNVAGERLRSEAQSHKGNIATQARSVANALEKAAGELGGQETPDWLRSSFRQGAQTLQRLADSVENKDLRELLDEVNALARAHPHPGAFLGACALAGFAVARVLKAGTAGAASPQRYLAGPGAQGGAVSGTSQAGAWPVGAGGAGSTAGSAGSQSGGVSSEADEALAVAISLGAA